MDTQTVRPERPFRCFEMFIFKIEHDDDNVGDDDNGDESGGWLMMMIVMTMRMFVGQLAYTKTKAIVTSY